MSKRLWMVIGAQCRGGAFGISVCSRLQRVCGLCHSKIVMAHTMEIRTHDPTWTVDFSEPAMSHQLRMAISILRREGASGINAYSRPPCVCNLCHSRIAMARTTVIRPRQPTWAADLSEPALPNRLQMVIGVWIGTIFLVSTVFV
jgi:hypothetical protein